MKIIFMGTPEFSVPSLKALIDSKNEILAVITQPDKKRGRGGKVSFSPVKEEAIKNNIPVFQPEKIKNDEELIKNIRNINPDFIVVVAFGQILSKEILDIPKFGCINLHASLLPKYRGAAPINWAVINGEEKTGNTTMLMDVGLDTGDMLLKSSYKIESTMSAGDVHDILMNDGGGLLVKTLEGIYNKQIDPKKQPIDCDFYAKMLDKSTGILDFNKKSIDILNLIRGLNPWPLAHTKYLNKGIKIIEAKKGSNVINKKATGEILNVSKDGIEIGTKDGSIIITKIQFENSKAMDVAEYIKGNKLIIGEILG